MNTTAARHAAILADERLAARKQGMWLAAIVLVCVAALWATGFFDAERLIEGGPALAQLFREMIPPDFGRWHSWLRPLADTLAMSIAGTALAVVISLPLALLSASNISPHPLIYHSFRIVLSGLRSVPELIMGIIFVAAVGFGALPGVLALALHSTGMVGKVLRRSHRARRPAADRGRACGGRQLVPGHYACGAAAGAAATGRHHDLPLGISFPGLHGAWHCRRRRHRL